ncbi:glycosyltransferase family 2 protein [Salinisphaera hydrothermalis]|uniref:glycosyltransferase family 2 protein n=1 Tax=Salinisphaera hydrothermalis TaxID=563188 RepID=UPI00333F1C78
MDHKPLVSIIIPIFNKELHLDECLLSVQRQDYPNCEVLLVDDGSADNCPHLCKKWVETQGYTYLRKANGGASSARNYGIKAASGDFLLFVDADDSIHCRLVSSLVAGALEFDSEIAAVCKRMFSTTPDLSEDLDQFSTCTPLELLRTGTSSCGRLFARTLFSPPAPLFPEGMWAEDSGYIPYLALRAQSIVLTQAAGYAYRVPSLGNASVSLRCIQDVPKAMNYLYSLIDDRKVFVYIAVRALNEALHSLIRTSQSSCDFNRYISTSDFHELSRNIRRSFALKYVREFDGRMRLYALLIYLWCKGFRPARLVYLRKFLLRRDLDVNH